MIPEPAITAWGLARRWPSLDQVEQDLLLARILVAIYDHPLLREELVFRGGTCLHQVHLPAPLRYSEDLDFVRRTHSEIGPILTALREVAATVGVDVHGTQIGQHPKMRLRAPATSRPESTLRIKIEINTHETSPSAPLIEVPFTVESSWFIGKTRITTFSLPELVATKLRALFQRSKGRDVFDLWLAIDQLGVDPAAIVECFTPYRPDGYTANRAIENLRTKLTDDNFRRDLDLLTTATPPGYAIDTAAERLIAEVLSIVPDIVIPERRTAPRLGP